MRALVTASNGRRVWCDAELTGMCPQGHPCYTLVLPFAVDRTNPPAVGVDSIPVEAHVTIVSMYSDDLAVVQLRERWRRMYRVALWFTIACCLLVISDCVLLTSWSYIGSHVVLVAGGFGLAYSAQRHARRFG